MLEVGCGAGHYLRYMAEQAPALAVTALDLQAFVVELAERNLRQWRLDGQVRLVHGDVCAFDSAEGFDLVTLHNNIYYFSEPRRAELLAHVRRLLRSSGRLLLTTSCRGGSPAIAALHLWWSLSDVAAGLPERDTLRRRRGGAPGAGLLGVAAATRGAGLPPGARHRRRHAGHVHFTGAPEA